jgi:ABC-type transport system involved in multi-copper enzyme maturation permease subunit
LQHPSFSPFRVAALAGNTFTGLVRLKVFYFLLLFALLLIGSSLFFARLSFQAEFQILKDVSLGAMNIFSSLLAIVATAQLIPRDLEERTIYPILAKPVARSEYLIGKLLGMLLLLALGILAMTALFLGLLFFREQILLGETTRSGLPPAQIAAAIASLKTSAFNLNLLPGILLIYLKAALLASLTLFVSTFASSNVFTSVTMVFVYFIGHLQATARTYWLQGHSSGWLAHTFLGLVALVFPDLQPFNLIDDVVAGTAIPLALFAKAAALGCVYTSVYLFFAWAAFHEREL